MNDVIDPRDLYATLDRDLDNLFSRSLIRRSEIIPNKYMRHPTPLLIIDRSCGGRDMIVQYYSTVPQGSMRISAHFAQSGSIHQAGSKSI